MADTVGGEIAISSHDVIADLTAEGQADEVSQASRASSKSSVRLSSMQKSVGVANVATVDSGPTAMLHAASRNGDLEKARASIASGGDVNALDLWGLGALHSASLSGHTQVVELLLEHGADVNALNKRSQTPLHMAATGCQDEVLDALVAKGADVLIRSGFGNTSLDVAKQFGEGGLCESKIRAEIQRRANSADSLAIRLRQELEAAELVRSTAEEQLGPPVGPDDTWKKHMTSESPVPAATEDGASDAGVKSLQEPGNERGDELMPTKSGKKKVKKKKGAIPSYWLLYEKLVQRALTHNEHALERATIRSLPKEIVDPYPWTGPLMSSGAVFPMPDPEDDILQTSFRRINDSAVLSKQREALRKEEYEPAPKEDAKVRDTRDRIMRRQTGKTQIEWNQLVVQMHDSEFQWDWSNIEIREREKQPKGMGLYGVFAVAPIEETEATPESPAEAEGDPSPKAEGAPSPKAGNPDETPEKVAPPKQPPIMFRQGDVVGPLGGIVRRKPVYECMYYPDKVWELCDPLSYEMQLRAQEVDLKAEPLVLDLIAGPAQNRLRHLADVRVDPLAIKGLATQGSSAPSSDAVLPTRTAMARPRSRANSPSFGQTTTSIRARQFQEHEASATADMSALASALGAEAPEEIPAVHAHPTVRIVEVLVDCWPHVFVVSLGNIRAGEELTVDMGEAWWLKRRLALGRLHEIGRISRDLLTGVKGNPDKEENDTLFPARKPMRKVESNAKSRQ